jgi:hypothetical protein
MEEILEKIYYNPKTGFLGFKKLWERYKEEIQSKNPEGEPWTQKKVAEWLKGQKVAQRFEVTSKKRKRDDYRPFIAYWPGEVFQIDLLIYDRFKYQSYRNILMVIDIYSRKLAARPLKSKSAMEIQRALKDMIQKDWDGIWPRVIKWDNEGAWKRGSRIDKWIREPIPGEKEWKSKILYSDPQEPKKNAIVERVNRTIALMLARWREETKRNDWPNVLQDIVDNYNSSIHSTAKNKPERIWNWQVANRQDLKKRRTETRFKLGDHVRVKKRQKTFQKGDRPSFFNDPFEIVDVERGLYRLKNVNTQKELNRRRAEYELQPMVRLIERKPADPPQAEGGIYTIKRVAKRRHRLRQRLEKEKLGEVNDEGTKIIPIDLRQPKPRNRFD